MAIDLGKFDERFFEDQLKLDEPEETNVNFIEAREKRQVIERLLFDRADGVKGRFDQIMAECDPLPGRVRAFSCSASSAASNRAPGRPLGPCATSSRATRSSAKSLSGSTTPPIWRMNSTRSLWLQLLPEHDPSGAILHGQWDPASRVGVGAERVCKGDQAKIVCAPRWAYRPMAARLGSHRNRGLFSMSKLSQLKTLFWAFSRKCQFTNDDRSIWIRFWLMSTLTGKFFHFLWLSKT